ncbi:hypothetical protein K437DRAFT_265444, partial [Tilletiaria anomala UBC 951]
MSRPSERLAARTNANSQDVPSSTSTALTSADKDMFSRVGAGVSKSAVLDNEHPNTAVENGRGPLGEYEKHSDEDGTSQGHSSSSLSKRDRNAIILLVVLYFLQGIPVGLAFGTMPYLLKAKLSYSDIGFFMLCTYPYSLKLFWSPLVDSIYLSKLRLPLLGTLHLGRRKTWIVPTQAIVGMMLWFLGHRVDSLLLPDIPNVYLITWLFFLLIFFAATQDIAVDGWALTLLSEENLSYASTAQTVGLNSGYFMSFTVFLAFNSVEFTNKWLRSVPQDYPALSLSLYLKMSGVLSLAVTTWLLFMKKEDPEPAHHEEMSIKSVYSTMWRIVQLT